MERLDGVFSYVWKWDEEKGTHMWIPFKTV